MHKYLAAIGFKQLESKRQLKKLLQEIVHLPDSRVIALSKEKTSVAEFCKDFAENLGICVCGELDEGKLEIEYYFPYLKGNGITSYEDVSVERHSSQLSYAGVCDDMRVGIALIFYLKNKMPYIKAEAENRLPIRGTTLTLSALSVGGTILLPFYKDEELRKRIHQESVNRNQLLAAAKQGDEGAIEILTMEDMDIMSTVSRQIAKQDLFSLVDTCLMPYGVECDQYSIVGEIKDMRMVTNSLTGEKVYILTIYCNELTFDVAINIIDLLGEPQVGRRFKGIIWLQGSINFPEEV